jgi:hypothetical protein
MSNAKMTIDDHSRAPDSGYQRTDEELAAQRDYEAREASRGKSAVQIYYRVIEGRPPDKVITRKVGWRAGRKIGEEKEALSQWFYRRVEVNDWVADQVKMDKNAAKRLGVHVHMTVR